MLNLDRESNVDSPQFDRRKCSSVTGVKLSDSRCIMVLKYVIYWRYCTEAIVDNFCCFKFELHMQFELDFTEARW